MAAKKPLEVNVAKIERHKGPIKVPEDMTLRQARDVLDRQMKYDEEVVSLQEFIKGFVGDAALAFYKAMKERYGWANQEPTWDWFGKVPPPMEGIPTGVDTSEFVPMGQFTLPGISGYLNVSVAKNAKDENRYQFFVYAETKRENEKEIRGLIDRARQLLKTESIYRGQAFKIHFTDASGTELLFPSIQFIDPSTAKEGSLILPRQTERDISARIWAPIRHHKLVRKSGVKLKRGVLLAGQFGTGKTLTAYLTAKIALENGFTFLYCEKASDLLHAIRAALQLGGPTVLFCEDIDRVTSGDRNASHDALLNLLDGVDTKAAELMVVFTTNSPEKIGEAFRRPGRIDVVIPVPTPDQDAAERLIRAFAGPSLDAKASISEAAAHLAGQIPAVIEEVVATAKLYAIDGHGDPNITPRDLIDAAISMQSHIEMLKPKGIDSRTTLEKFAYSFGVGLKQAATTVKAELGGQDGFNNAVALIEGEVAPRKGAELPSLEELARQDDLRRAASGD